jgi:hypothetical protein
MSWASIDSSGLLHHSIQNKDVIPAKKYEINKFVGKKYYIEKRIPYKVEVIKYKYDKWFFILLGYAVLTIIYKI